MKGSPNMFLQADVWSNMFFVLPFVAALLFKSWGMAGLIGLSAALSWLYHFSNEARYGTADRFVAHLLAVANAGLVAFGGFQAPYFYYTLAFVFAAMYFYHHEGASKHPTIDHTLWHLASALVTVFSLFTFYLS